MHVAYIQRNPSRPTTSPAHVAAEGFDALGYEVIWFNQEDAESLDIQAHTVVVGFIEVFRKAIQKLTGVICPVYNYPEELRQFLGREIVQMDLRFIQNNPALWPVFIKPAEEVKTFTGRLITRDRDLVVTATLPGNTQVWVSTPVNFVSDYRCFVKNSKVMACRNYRGDPLIFPDSDQIKSMVVAWTNSPAAYCLDVGVTDSGQTLLVEVNDAYSAGTYGFDPASYARFIETRWCELTGAKPIP